MTRQPRTAATDSKEGSYQNMLDAKEIVDKAFTDAEKQTAERIPMLTIESPPPAPVEKVKKHAPVEPKATADTIKVNLIATRTETSVLREQQKKLQEKYACHERLNEEMLLVKNALDTKLARVALERQQKRMVLQQFQSKIERQVHFLQLMSSDLEKRSELMEKAYDQYETAVKLDATEQLDQLMQKA